MRKCQSFNNQKVGRPPLLTDLQNTDILDRVCQVLNSFYIPLISMQQLKICQNSVR